jgi:hypothetical protein
MNGLWVLAGQDSNGEIAILIANPTDQPVTLTLLRPDGQAVQAATRLVVSDASEAIQESTGGAQIQIPAYAV